MIPRKGKLRVREWRAANPGYWRRTGHRRAGLISYCRPLYQVLSLDRPAAERGGAAGTVVLGEDLQGGGAL